MIKPILLVLLLFVYLAITLVQSAVPEPSNAVEVWEKALAAKGGREKLHAISNFLVVRKRPRRQSPNYSDLYIFPDRYWSWSNSGGVLGTSLLVHDSTGTWEAYDDRQGRGVIWFSPAETGEGDMENARALFLMETKWYKPKIVGLTTERLKKEEFEVVTVDAGRDRVKYYIDMKTSLVRRVSPEGRYGKIVTIAEDMMDYRSVQGIMMPSRTSTPEVGTYNLEFAFDVEYDPGIFKRKPSIEDGPDGWKPKK
jgi:hypothetical protein